MEYTHVELIDVVCKLDNNSLNPYFIGIYSRSYEGIEHPIHKVVSLNPYFIGIYSRSNGKEIQTIRER